VEWGGYYSVS